MSTSKCEKKFLSPRALWEATVFFPFTPKRNSLPPTCKSLVLPVIILIVIRSSECTQSWAACGWPSPKWKWNSGIAATKYDECCDNNKFISNHRPTGQHHRSSLLARRVIYWTAPRTRTVSSPGARPSAAHAHCVTATRPPISINSAGITCK